MNRICAELKNDRDSWIVKMTLSFISPPAKRLMSEKESYSEYLATVSLSSVGSFNDWTSLLCEGYLCCIKIRLQQASQPYLWSDSPKFGRFHFVRARRCTVKKFFQKNRKTENVSIFLLFAFCCFVCPLWVVGATRCHRPMIVVLLNFNFSMCL